MVLTRCSCLGEIYFRGVLGDIAEGEFLGHFGGCEFVEGGLFGLFGVYVEVVLCLCCVCVVFGSWSEELLAGDMERLQGARLGKVKLCSRIGLFQLPCSLSVGQL